LVVAVCVSAVHAAETSVASETSLRSAPDGGTMSAFVTAGTPVDVVERDGEWVRVRLEGWVRADVLAAPAVEPAPAAEVPVAAAPAAAVASTAAPGATTPSAAGAIEGLVQVQQGAKKKKKKAGAAGAQVMLLPGDFEPSANDPEAQAQIEALEAEAAKLRQAAKKAMHLGSFSEATRTHDALMKERRAVLSQRLDILAARHGRHEAEVRRVAITSTLTDSKGWYSISDVSPGAYVVYSRMTREDLDVEWFESVEVAQGAVRRDLDDSNALSMPPPKK
jgi:hypothetical protein